MKGKCESNRILGNRQSAAVLQRDWVTHQKPEKIDEMASLADDSPALFTVLSPVVRGHCSGIDGHDQHLGFADTGKKRFYFAYVRSKAPVETDHQNRITASLHVKFFE